MIYLSVGCSSAMISPAHESNKRTFDLWIMTSSKWSKCIIVKYIWFLILLVTRWASSSPQNYFIPLHRARGEGRLIVILLLWNSSCIRIGIMDQSGAVEAWTLRFWYVNVGTFELYLRFILYLFEDCSVRLSPGESWAGGPPNPWVRPKERWGLHSWYQSLDFRSL